MAIKSRDQLAIDETVVEDDRLLSALLEREKAKAVAGELAKEAAKAHERALAEIEKLELPDGRAVRIGQFRIERSESPARSVVFETKPKSRIRISRLDDE